MHHISYILKTYKIIKFDSLNNFIDISFLLFSIHRACVILGVIFILSSMCILGKAIHDLATKLLPEVVSSVPGCHINMRTQQPLYVYKTERAYEM